MPDPSMRVVVAALFLCCAVLAQATRTFTGIVVDERGAPLEGVAICPFDVADAWLTSELVARSPTRSGADGRFRVEVTDAEFDEVLFVGRGRVHVMERLEW